MHFRAIILCMPNLWPKGFTHKTFQLVMINGSEIGEIDKWL